MKTITVSISHERKPLDGFARILHDYERPPYLPRSLNPGYPLDDHLGFPEMCPTLEKDYMQMTEDWQELQFQLLTHFSPSSMTKADRIKAWRDFYNGMKFLTNKRSWIDSKGIKYADFISGKDLDSPLPSFQSLSCGGNLVKTIGAPVVKAGQLWQQVECIDANKRPPRFEECNYAVTPWLVHVAVTSTPFGLDGGWTEEGPWRCNPFPQNRGAHCCFPFASKKPAYILVERLGPVYEIPPWPYNP